MSSRGCAPMRSAWGLRATQGEDAATPPIESIDAHDVGGSAATSLCRLLPPELPITNSYLVSYTNVWRQKALF